MRDAVAVRDACLAVEAIARVDDRRGDPGTVDVIDCDNVDDLVYGEVRQD
jgi:hypothetical protein